MAPFLRAGWCLRLGSGAGFSRGRAGIATKMPHSTELRGRVRHRSSKASRGENLEIEQPVACRDFASFDFHTTLPGMLGPTLVRHQIVQMGQPAQKRLVAPFGVMEAFHRE